MIHLHDHTVFVNSIKQARMSGGSGPITSIVIETSEAPRYQIC